MIDEKIMTNLLENKNEYERKQEQLKNEHLFFCPLCKKIKKLSEKSGKRDKCHECWKKQRNERNKLKALVK